MHDFIFKEIKNSDMVLELKSIDFDKSYAQRASDKFKYKNIKIFNLTLPQVNILKQTALSVGADCGTHHESITGKIELSDCILTGNLAQLNKIADKLKYQPFSMKFLGEELKSFCQIQKEAKTKLMGILNLTENSFSDGGMYFEFEDAKKHLLEMVGEGVDIIDIGAESTKPYSSPVSVKAQLEKIIPILEFIKSENCDNVQVSIDTRSAEVAHKCLEYKIDYINDVSGLIFDENMVNVVASSDVKIIIQHSNGTPENMQDNPCYENLMDEIYLDLKSKIDGAISKGVKKENIIIDAGIGFGKTKDDNFEILRRVEELYGLGCPVLLGVSRKSLLGMENATNEEKDIYTLALNALLIEKNIDIIRVHNVKMHKKLLEMLKH